MDYAETSKQGKRKYEYPSLANTSASKRYCDPATRANEDVQVTKQVKEIMKKVEDKLLSKPSSDFNSFLRDRISAAETNKKLIGVFGKTGAGKSSLINAILGENNLLPSGDITACTSVMVQVEANMINSKYMALIEFIKKEEWEDELRSSKKKTEDNSDNESDDNDSDDHDDSDYDRKLINAVYGKDMQDESPEDLIDKKYFRDIPEFLQSENRTKQLSFSSVSELSTEIAKYIRTDLGNENGTERYYWPLVKSVTIKLPNVDELLEHVALVDLPGTGDCNKSRDEMWKSIVGRCSAVWIVSDTNRAVDEKEPWEILDRTISLIGNGGECQSISFICTKSDCIDNPRDTSKEKGRELILQRNMKAKKVVKQKCYKIKGLQKNFSNTEDLFQVFTVSSKEFQRESENNFLQKDETEIPQLQQFLRTLNDQQSKAVSYVSRAHSIINLIHNSANGEMNKEASVCGALKQRLDNELLKISQSMEGVKNTFQECLSVGESRSKDSCLRTMKKVTEPKNRKDRGYHKVLKSLVQNDGVYKPKRRKKGKRGTEINLNEKLASCMLNQADDLFKKTFPNQVKNGPIRGKIDQFTLGTKNLIDKHQGMSIQLSFLETEEEQLKSKLDDDICKKKKEIYAVITQSIKTSMTPCYKDAAKHTGKDTLKKMRKDIEEHVKISKDTMFEKAQTDMLELIEKLGAHILETLRSGLSDSIQQVLRNHDVLLLDVKEEYEQLKICMEKLMGGSNKVPSINLEEPISHSALLPSKVGIGPHAQVSLEAEGESVRLPPLDKINSDWRAQERSVTAFPVFPSDFVETKRNKLIQRVQNVLAIADDLLACKVLSNELYAKVDVASRSQNKMRVLLTAVLAAGVSAKSAFCEALKHHEPLLVQDLLRKQ